MKRLRVILTFAWLVGFYFYPSVAFPLRQPSLIGEKQCDRCHGFDRESKKSHAPNLYYAGEKFQLEWLLHFLSTPETIRLVVYSTDPGFLKGEKPPPHPAVSKDVAKKLVDYLVKLKKETSEDRFESGPLSKGKKARAKIKFERDYGCISCHQAINFAGKARGGISGPSLVNAGNRLNADWIYRWLKKPKAYETKSRMPVFEITEEDLIDLVKYIMTLKKENLR
tara:strand:+ start:4220 stop:4891 length:672 start_codon:yes stop_codon:yes gene_type:complete